MPLTSAQIVSQALTIAKVPGYTSQGGQLLNAILQELAQTYDFDACRGLLSFNFNPGLNGTFGAQQLAGSGPYPLPADYLRMEPEDFFWFLLGVPYPMVAIDISEFDVQVQQAGLTSYPYWFATDMSTTPPSAYVYPPPSGAFPVSGRYRRQMPDIATPETSTAVPWFAHQNYLITRLAGEVMKITDDTRAPEFLGDTPMGAQGILNRLLKLIDDHETRAKTVRMDRRRFGARFSNLRNTKIVGWGLAAMMVLPAVWG